MASITEYGMMSLTSNDNVANYSTSAKFRIGFTSQPRGSLYIKNQTTGAEKRIPVGSLNNGDFVWDAAVDDPTYASGATEWTFEFSGKADGMYIVDTISGQFAVYAAIWNGNGSAEASGTLVKAG